MLSYQHAYHAGNGADLHKHAALATLLERLTQKARGVSYLESHAGRGIYDLSAPEAAKTGEASLGIGRVRPGGAFGRAIATVRARHGPTAYPGSPMIAHALLRPQDRLTLCELHPQEHRALARILSGDTVGIHNRDGHEGLPALCPPTPRRGLALIDPSYEVKSEYERTAATARAILARWPEATIVVWYPILQAARHERLLAELRATRPARLLISEAGLRGRAGRGMVGSGLVILNAPHGAETALIGAWEPLEPVLDFG